MQKTRTARTAAALLTALLLVFFLSAGPGLAVDVTRPVSLTVDIGEKDALGGSSPASVVVDLYCVGEAVGSDRGEISLRAEGAFAGLDLSSGKDRDALRRLTDEAMALAIPSGSPVVTGAVPGRRIAAGDDGKPLAAGMYLVVPHGEGMDPADYCVRTADESGAVHILTVAGSASCDYTFQPQLLTLPIRAEAAELYDCEIEESGEDFIFDARVSFKYEEAPRKGKVKLTKTLLSHRDGDRPTFLFSVDVRQGGYLILSDIYTLSFDKAGEKSLVIDGLPAGAEVTVSEVYSGAGYRLISPAVQTAVIGADALEELRFVNEHENTDREGGSLVNRFTYSAESGWGWQQLPASEG